MRNKIIFAVGCCLCTAAAAYSQQKKGIVATAIQLNELMVADTTKIEKPYVWGTVHTSTPVKTGDLTDSVFGWFPAIVISPKKSQTNHLYLLKMPSK
ncbi:hypothetical protein FFWV33_16880 [Flavobacterium faecale]|uniref:Uncharacterized protein n=1 Tax=Flavobacterium faecale TaxID=1355330 RepID=A0A2S1LH82_9FLAO|nr:hypothetical protein [Flavobacterium faecale]AWG23079.1 hypothetical protein FFWV33_16880 [Flavobacterium faecale]